MTQRSLWAILAVVLVLGAVLRLALYLHNYSLFLDECALALNFDTSDIGALTGPLRYDQAAPFGFLLIQNAVVRSLGMGEMVLRGISLVAGILALPAIWWACRKRLSKPASIAAVWLLAVNHGLVAYSAQAKQYSGEVLAAALIIGLCWPLFDEALAPGAYWGRVIAAGLLLWFSFSALFLLAGMLATLFAQGLLARHHAALRRALGAGAVWLMMTIPVFALSMRGGLSNARLVAMWNADYLPWRTPAKLLPWLFAHASELLILVFNQRLWTLAAIVLLCGLWYAVRNRQWAALAAAVAVLACLGASALRVYPFHGRLLLFLIPGLVVILVLGGEFLWISLSPNWRSAWACLATFCLIWTLVSAARFSIFGNGYIDEPREALRLLQFEQQPNDEVFVTPLATPCFVYYRQRLGLRGHPKLDATFPSRTAVPATPGARQWLVAMRTPWEQHGEAVVAQSYFAARTHEVKRRDVEWTSVILYSARPGAAR